MEEEEKIDRHRSFSIYNPRVNLLSLIALLTTDNLALTLSRATCSVTRTHAHGGGGFTLASIFSVDGFPFKRSLCVRRFLCSVSRAPYRIDASQAG